VLTSEVLYQLSYVGDAASLAALQAPLVRREARVSSKCSRLGSRVWSPSGPEAGWMRWSFALPQRPSPYAVAAPHAADHPACGQVYGCMSESSNPC